MVLGILRVFGAVLNLLWNIEEKIFGGIIRACRGDGEYSVKIDNIKILHESANFLVVEKQHDVLINGGVPNQMTLDKQMQRLYPDLVNPNLSFGFYFPHRLDYATSGILCIAKNKRACGAAGLAFQRRNSQKLYLAILRGHVSKDFLTINESIGKDTREEFDGVRMAGESISYCSEVTRHAITHLIVLERGICYGYPATKVLLCPITGRRHQLRIHSNCIGHTIVGDFTYSNRRDILPYRMFLHAYHLELNTKIELLDITTEDPFSTTNPKNQWKSCQEVLTIPEAVRTLTQRINSQC